MKKIALCSIAYLHICRRALEGVKREMKKAARHTRMLFSLSLRTRLRARRDMMNETSRRMKGVK